VRVHETVLRDLLVVQGDPGDIHALSTAILTAFMHDTLDDRVGSVATTVVVPDRGSATETATHRSGDSCVVPFSRGEDVLVSCHVQ